MSININWENLTGGEDGAALAETIRAFIHERFQQVPLPKMIRSVRVHSFDFGTVAPDLELKDVSDPLPEFYEGSSSGLPSDDENGDLSPVSHGSTLEPNKPVKLRTGDAVNAGAKLSRSVFEASSAQQDATHSGPDHQHATAQNQSPTDYSPFLSRASTPGIPGGTTNLSYFHQPLSAGLPGSTSAFAAVAGAHLPHGYGWPDTRSPALTRTNSIAGAPFPADPPRNPRMTASALDTISEDGEERSAEDVQVVMRLRYAGDVGLTLTADILLDYPMPSFARIPLQLRVTGVAFDGIAILAYIKRKAHFCFLAPEDAETLVGQDPSSPVDATDARQDGDDAEHCDQDANSRDDGRVGGLFDKIRIESEIGQKASGKQVLKNVGMVEKFILEQVRRIFETEFVHPSFWTFLV